MYKQLPKGVLQASEHLNTIEHVNKRTFPCT